MSIAFPYHPPTPAPQTLKERVEAFWNWYAANALAFFNAIEEGQCSSLQPSVSAAVDVLLPEMAWVFGPGPDRVGHSFTLSPEANPYRRLISHYWRERAPQLEGWTFHSSRQAGNVTAGMSMRIGEHTYRPEEIWVTPWVDEQEEMIDLTIWHAAFDTAPPDHRGLATFLWLDEVLSENDVTNWIGDIKFGDDQLSQAISLMELPEFIADLQQERSWEKYPPGEAYLSYHGPAHQNSNAEQEQENDEAPPLRSDIIAGSTTLFHLVCNYPLEENPVASLGAEFIMIVLPTAQLPKGSEVDERGKLEDSLDELLKSHGAGIVLGGAVGVWNSYIDLVFYDGERSRQLVLDALANGKFGDTAWLAPFTPEDL